jgi:hypothetical protein
MATKYLDNRAMFEELEKQKSKPSVTASGSDLWMFFASRFREEYGFEPNPRDKTAKEYFSWFAWGQSARDMGWAVNQKNIL